MCSDVIDMSNQQRINRRGGTWPRCRDVTLRDGVLHCALDRGRAYVLIEAYRSNPHVQFANAETDRHLIAFLRRWGPPFLNPETPGVVNISLAPFRVEQRWFRALLGLLHASRLAENEAEAFRAFIGAEHELAGLISSSVKEMEVEAFSSPLSAELRKEFHIEGSIPDWTRSADLGALRAARACVIRDLPIGASTHLVCGRRYIEAGWNLYDLMQALRWMVWYDVFNQRPIICCPECGKVKRAKTARANRKFCSQRCAHRATAREWQKKYNKRKRAERRVAHSSLVLF